MKTIYITDIKQKFPIGSRVEILGWIKSKRCSKEHTFLSISDSTGTIQVVVERGVVNDEVFENCKSMTVESAVRVYGTLQKDGSDNGSPDLEVLAIDFEVTNKATHQLSPPPRSEIDIFDPTLQNHFLNNRHFYLRNEKIMAILRFRAWLMGAVHQWFREQGFLEITAPTLTPVPLYEDGSALSVIVNNEKIYLTQCVGFYLEAAVHAFEKVYNLGPSFRGEESRSKRHLMEYWHIKAEIAFGDLEDIINFVESLISFVTTKAMTEAVEFTDIVGHGLNIDGLNPPFPRMSYTEAVEILKANGLDFEFGKSLGSEEEAILSRDYNQPLWVVGIPRSIEPFPYVIDSNDTRCTMTADLIATKGYGELLGVAEKIHDPAMLDERMIEKGKDDNELYQWLRDMRNYGCVSHIGFGLGLERFIRWLMQIEHVRDTMPFPRTFRRKVRP